MTRDFADLLCGGGGFALGAIAAGLSHAWSVEADAAIADCHERNIPGGVIRALVQDVDYKSLPRVWWLHMSPICTNASNAKTDGAESAEDIAIADACARAIRDVLPVNVSLENVYPYRNFESFRRICKALEEGGYNFKYWHLNSADYGGWVLCPLHDTSEIATGAVSRCSAASLIIAPDIIKSIATMLPEGQAWHLAKIAVAHLVNQTGRVAVVDAVCGSTVKMLAGKREYLTTLGKAAELLTNGDISRFVSTASTDANIESLLKICLDAPLIKEKWSTISTTTQQITVQKIFASILATVCISQNTTTSGGLITPTGTSEIDGAASNCPLCRYTAVPQTRKRLILLASREKRVSKPEPTHIDPKKINGQGSLFGGDRLPWVGWYEAIEDLIPTLPESGFADWQLKRLPELLQTSLVGQQYDKAAGSEDRAPQVPPAAQPAMTVTASLHTKGKSPVAFIVRSSDQRENCKIARDSIEPVFTLTEGNTGHARVKAFIVDGQETVPTADGGRTASIRTDDEPMLTIPGSIYKGLPRAFVVDGQNARGEGLTVRTDGQPMHTVSNQSKAYSRAYIIGGGNTNKDKIESKARAEHQPAFTVASGDNVPATTRAWLSQGRVVAMTPRALARFQAFPDSYELPEKVSLACRIIGNAIPPLLATRIIQSITGEHT